MASTLERRYRRVLRLLPQEYRRVWEEDMVSAFLAAAAHGGRRRLLSESLSVVALAVRHHLGQPLPAAQTRLRHHVLYCLTLMALAFLALTGSAATVGAVTRAVQYVTGAEVFANPGSLILGILVGGVLGPLWAVAYWCFVRGRLAPARIVLLGTLVVLLAAMTGPFVLAVADGRTPGLAGLAAALPILAVFAALTMALFAVPADARAPRPALWLGGWVTGSVVLGAADVVARLRPELWLPWLDPLTLVRALLLVGMAVALATAAGRRRADWLIALVVAAGTVTLGLGLAGAPGVAVLDGSLLLLAVACAWCGRLAARQGQAASYGQLKID